jgi:hypothetical protein
MQAESTGEATHHSPDPLYVGHIENLARLGVAVDEVSVLATVPAFLLKKL